MLIGGELFQRLFWSNLLHKSVFIIIVAVICRKLLLFEWWRHDWSFFLLFRKTLTDSLAKMIDEGLRALMFSKLGLTVLFLHLGRARDSRSHRPTADLCLRDHALGQFDPLLLKIAQ